MELKNYDKEEWFDPATVEALKGHYTEILRLLGEDPAREGLLKTCLLYTSPSPRDA